MATVVVWKSDEDGWLKLMNSERVNVHLHVVGEEMIAIAKTVFELRSKHEDRPPEFYLASFGTRTIRFLGKRGVEVYNSDRTAEWVEFGAHADGKTRILKYRVFGTAMDLMNARARVTR